MKTSDQSWAHGGGPIFRDRMENHWIALDGTEPCGHFRSAKPLSETIVLRLVRSLLPEVGEPRIVAWSTATQAQRFAVAHYPPFTPVICTKLGLRILTEPSPPPPSPVKEWAERLQKRFAQTADLPEQSPKRRTLKQTDHLQKLQKRFAQTAGGGGR